jgi:hypothetical protein
MLSGRTVTVYCENHREQTDVRIVSLYDLHILNLGMLRRHSSCCLKHELASEFVILIEAVAGGCLGAWVPECMAIDRLSVV